MEELLLNIINENENVKEKNLEIHKKEILVVGDIQDYRARMSKNFIRFMDYLKDNMKNYKIIYYGTGIPNFDKNKELKDVIKIMCKDEKPIVWICDIRGPLMTCKIDEYDGIKIYDFEDLMGKVETIIRQINEYKFGYAFYKYDCPTTEKIKENCKNTKFYQYDHYIDDNIFKDYGFDKEIDILCYGSIDYGVYPFRKRLFELFSNNKNFKTLVLDHPSYGYNKKHSIVEENLSKIINKSKLTVVTSSTLEFLLKKYTEVALSNSCMIGRLPKYGNKYYENCLIEINETMTDEEIINKTKEYLNDNEKLMEIMKRGNNIGKKYFTYEYGCNYIEKILENIK